MPYTIKESKSYPHPPEVLLQAAKGAIEGLEGQVQNEDPQSHALTAFFDKKILGRVLGERTQLQVRIEANEGGNNAVSIEAYPLDAVGRKLMFGARKGVTRTVVTWFYAHLENRLPAD